MTLTRSGAIIIWTLSLSGMLRTSWAATYEGAICEPSQGGPLTNFAEELASIRRDVSGRGELKDCQDSSPEFAAVVAKAEAFERGRLSRIKPEELDPIRLEVLKAVSEYSPKSCFKDRNKLSLLCPKLQGQNVETSFRGARAVPGARIPMEGGLSWVKLPDHSTWSLKGPDGQTTLALAMTDSNGFISEIDLDQGVSVSVDESTRFHMTVQTHNYGLKAMKRINLRKPPYSDRFNSMSNDERCMGAFGSPVAMLAEIAGQQHWSAAESYQTLHGLKSRAALEGALEGYEEGGRGAVIGIAKGAVGFGKTTWALVEFGWTVTQALDRAVMGAAKLLPKTRALYRECKERNGGSVTLAFSCMSNQASADWQAFTGRIGAGLSKAAEKIEQALRNQSEKIADTFHECFESRDRHLFPALSCLSEKTGEKTLDGLEIGVRGIGHFVERAFEQCLSHFDEQFAECMGTASFYLATSAVGTEVSVLSESAVKTGALAPKVGQAISYTGQWVLNGATKNFVVEDSLSTLAKKAAGAVKSTLLDLDSAEKQLLKAGLGRDAARELTALVDEDPSFRQHKAEIMSLFAWVGPHIRETETRKEVIEVVRHMSASQDFAPRAAADLINEAIHLGKLSDLKTMEMSSLKLALKQEAAKRIESQESGRVLGSVAPVKREIALETAALTPIESSVLQKVREGAKFSYVVDTQDRIFAVEGRLQAPEGDGKLWALRRTEGGPAVIVKEAGSVEFEPGTKKILYNSFYDLGSAPEETAQINETLRRLEPEAQVAHAVEEGASSSRVFTCSDILSKQLAGTRFVTDRLIAGNLMTAGTVFYYEQRNEEKSSEKPHGSMLAEEVLSGNVSTIVSTTVGKAIVNSGADWPTSLMARRTSGGVLNMFQKELYRQMVSENGAEPKQESLDSAANDISRFNRGYNRYMLPVNQLTDRFVLKKLPMLLYDACLRDGSLRFVVSPRLFRIYQVGATTLIYYGLRDSYLQDHRKAEAGSEGVPQK